MTDAQYVEPKKQSIQQDFNDLMELFGSEIRRNPCGHLWHRDFVCKCGVDHDDERFQARLKAEDLSDPSYNGHPAAMGKLP